MHLTQCHKNDTFDVSVIISSGFVVSENKKQIVLAGDLVDQDGDIRRVIIIPKENIIR